MEPEKRRAVRFRPTSDISNRAGASLWRPTSGIITQVRYFRQSFVKLSSVFRYMPSRRALRFELRKEVKLKTGKIRRGKGKCGRTMKKTVTTIVACALLFALVAFNATAQTNSKHRQMTQAKTVRCKNDDMECFLQAAETCRKANITVTQSIDIFGMVATATSY